MKLSLSVLVCDIVLHYCVFPDCITYPGLFKADESLPSHQLVQKKLVLPILEYCHNVRKTTVLLCWLSLSYLKPYYLCKLCVYYYGLCRLCNRSSLFKILQNLVNSSIISRKIRKDNKPMNKCCFSLLLRFKYSHNEHFHVVLSLAIGIADKCCSHVQPQW